MSPTDFPARHHGAIRSKLNLAIFDQLKTTFCSVLTTVWRSVDFFEALGKRLEKQIQAYNLKMYANVCVHALKIAGKKCHPFSLDGLSYY